MTFVSSTGRDYDMIKELLALFKELDKQKKISLESIEHRRLVAERQLSGHFS